MTRNLILVSGGPGAYDSTDPDRHDGSWSNYVDGPLLLTRDATPPLLPRDADEQVWWFIYRPAYLKRWALDVARTDPAGRKAVKQVRDEGFADYTALLTARAADRGWNLRWLERAADLWTKLGTFQDSISRLWYWGHGSTDLWLTVKRGPPGQGVSKPEPHEILGLDDVTAHANLRARFQPGDASRRHRFLGCNTADYAKRWHEIFGVHTQGVHGTLNFDVVHPSGGEPAPAPGADWVECP